MVIFIKKKVTKVPKQVKNNHPKTSQTKYPKSAQGQFTSILNKLKKINQVLNKVLSKSYHLDCAPLNSVVELGGIKVLFFFLPLPFMLLLLPFL